MQRPMPEVLASQDQMLRHRGNYKEGPDPARIAAAFEKHLMDVYEWLEGRLYVKFLPVPYHDLLTKPLEIDRCVSEFLGIALDLKEMAGQVDASLYRNRTGTELIADESSHR